MKFEINQTKIKGACQSGIKVVVHNSKSDLPLAADAECSAIGRKAPKVVDFQRKNQEPVDDKCSAIYLDKASSTLVLRMLN